MFERRLVWGILIGLTICMSIWRISVQEPSMLAAEYGYSSGSVGGINNPQIAYYQQQQLYGKHLLGRKTNDASEQALTEDDELHHSDTELDKSTVTATAAKLAPIQIQIETLKRKSTTATLSSLEQDVAVNKTNASYIYNSSNSNTKSSGKRSLPQVGAHKLQKTFNEYREGGTLPAPPWYLYHYSTRSRNQNGIKRRNNRNLTATTTTTAAPTPEPAVTLERQHFDTSTAASKAQVTLLQQQQQQLPPNDFQQLIDMPNFEYTMRQSACDDSVAALILVHSAPHNFPKRLLIRETWGSGVQLHTTPLRLIFLLGAVDNDTLQRHLREENAMFGDMVQGNFMDDYKNMTYKHVMAFKWFIYNCANAQILVKVDDDVFVNTPQLLQYLEATQEQTYPKTGSGDTSSSSAAYYSWNTVPFLSAAHNNTNNIDATTTTTPFSPAQRLFNHPHDLLFCQQLLGSRVKRSYRSKWRVSVREYAKRFYPPYCPGYSIIYSPDVLLRLYSAAQRYKYFWIDDVHVTGTLAQLANITITSSLPYVLDRNTCNSALAGKTDLASLDFLFAWSDITEQQIRELWQLHLLSNSKTPKKFKMVEQAYMAESSEADIYDGFR